MPFTIRHELLLTTFQLLSPYRVQFTLPFKSFRKCRKKSHLWPPSSRCNTTISRYLWLIRCCHLKNEAGILLEMAIIGIKCAKYQDNFEMAALQKNPSKYVRSMRTIEFNYFLEAINDSVEWSRIITVFWINIHMYLLNGN